MNSLCRASILRLSRDVVNRSDRRVLRAVKRTFCKGEAKCFGMELFVSCSSAISRQSHN